MGKINWGRVVLGGLLAGLVINIGELIINMGILGQQWKEAMAALNVTPMSEGPATAAFVVLGFLLGIVAVAAYASVRPRFGPGPKTAITAGLLVWFLAALYPTVGVIPMNMFPARLLIYSMVWTFFELPIATLVGAWLYKEEEPAQS